MPYLLSDTHVTNDKEYKFFINLIHSLSQDDDVILLGDIFDFTKVPFIDLEYIIDDLDKPQIYYIYGNHDIIAPELGFKCYEQYKYDGVHFEHGHRFESLLKSTGFTTPSEYNELFERLCYNKNINGVIADVSWNIWHIITKLKRNLHKRDMANELFKFISKKGNIVIGHTHYEQYSKIRKVLICDDAKLSDVSNSEVYRRTNRTNIPVGYFLRTDTFGMESFEIDTKATLRSALNAKRTCLRNKY